MRRRRILQSLELERSRVLLNIAALEPAELATAAIDLNSQISALDALIEHVRIPHKPWKPAAVVALLAVSAVLFVSKLHTERTAIGLDVQATAVELTTANRENDTAQNDKAISVLSAQTSRGVDVADAIISNILVLPTTSIGVVSDEAGCIRIEVRAARGLGITLEIVSKTSDRSVLPMPTSAELGRGDWLFFCPRSEGRFLLFDNPSSVNISRLFRVGPPSVRTSSIESGSLFFAQTGEQLKLRRGDQIKITGGKSSTLAFVLNKQARIIYSGDARDIDQQGAGTGSQASLKPSILDVLVSSIYLKGLVAAATGLIGGIWAVYRYFMRSSF